MRFIQYLLKYFRNIFGKKRKKEGWWNHYNFDSEPSLNIEPLEQKSDIRDLFYGRTNEIRRLKVSSSTTGKTAFIYIGSAGIGKTSFINKTFENNRGYFRVDLSHAKGIDSFDQQIAYDCINHLKKLNINYKDLMKSLKKTITTSNSVSIYAGTPLLGGGVSRGENITDIRDFRLVEIIKEALKRLNNMVSETVILLDETDKIQLGNIANLIQLFSRIKDYMLPPSTIIFTNRDYDSKLYTDYNDSNSVLASIFDDFHSLEGVFNGNLKDTKKILEPRFQKGNPNSDYKQPLNNYAINWISTFSDGNIRNLLKYTKQVLIEGIQRGKAIPLKENFVSDILIQKYPNIIVKDSKDIKLLKYLNKTPSSPSDTEFQTHMGSARQTISDRLEELEKKMFVRKTTIKKTGKHIYHVTDKSIKSIEYSEL